MDIASKVFTVIVQLNTPCSGGCRRSVGSTNIHCMSGHCFQGFHSHSAAQYTLQRATRGGHAATHPLSVEDTRPLSVEDTQPRASDTTAQLTVRMLLSDYHKSNSEYRKKTELEFGFINQSSNCGTLFANPRPIYCQSLGLCELSCN